MIEDQERPKRCGHMAGTSVIPFAEAVGKVEAADAARREHAPELLVKPRTDAATTRGLDEAIQRLRAFADAGADIVFADALTSEPDICRVADEVDGEDDTASIVGTANPNVFLRARNLGLDGTELPEELADPDFLSRLELIRGAACERLGLVDDRGDAADEPAAVPQIAVMSAPQSYERVSGERVDADALDVTARIVTTQTPHHSCATTGAMCLAAATRIDGALPAAVGRGAGRRVGPVDVTIGHPKGTITIGVKTAISRSTASASAAPPGASSRVRCTTAARWSSHPRTRSELPARFDPVDGASCRPSAGVPPMSPGSAGRSGGY
jgi:hypothetical protein